MNLIRYQLKRDALSLDPFDRRNPWSCSLPIDEGMTSCCVVPFPLWSERSAALIQKICEVSEISEIALRARDAGKLDAAWPVAVGASAYSDPLQIAGDRAKLWKICLQIVSRPWHH